MERFDKVWTTCEYIFVGLASLIAIFVGFYGVLMRYVFTQPVGWTEEVIMYLMVWALLVIISPVERNREHIKLDLLYNKYPPKVRPIVDLFILLISLVFVVTVIIYGFNIVENYIEANQRSQSSLNLPLWIVRLSVPVGFALWGVRLIQSSLKVIKEIRDVYSSNGAA